MKTLRLTENQLIKLYHGNALKTTQQGNVFYIEPFADEIIIKDMTGKVVEDYKLSDEDLDYII